MIWQTTAVTTSCLPGPEASKKRSRRSPGEPSATPRPGTHPSRFVEVLVPLGCLVRQTAAVRLCESRPKYCNASIQSSSNQKSLYFQMAITRRVTFRLYPNASSEQVLHHWRRLHCLLYNAAIANRRTQYGKFGHSVDYFEQQNSLPEFKQVWPEYKPLGSHALQATLKRVDFAFQRFFRGIGGRPKFKSSRYYRGWTYPCSSGWSALTNGKHGHLKLSNLATPIRMRGEARTWGKPTTCTVIWTGGKWYASITVKCVPIRQTGTGAIGLDFGCQTAVADSNGEKIQIPEQLQQLDRDIKRAEKSKRRKQRPNRKQKVRGSRRWKKAQKRVSKLKRRQKHIRHDWVHQTATQILSANSLVATEKLNLKGMTRKPRKGSPRKGQKTGLNRSILKVGMGMLRSAIEYKLGETDGRFVEVPTQKVKPSQTCPNCGHQQKKALSQRVHHCQQCDYQADRDVAAAQLSITWARGREPTSLDADGTSSGASPAYCGGMHKLGQLKRQKLTPTT